MLFRLKQEIFVHTPSKWFVISWSNAVNCTCRLGLSTGRISSGSGLARPNFHQDCQKGDPRPTEWVVGFDGKGILGWSGRVPDQKIHSSQTEKMGEIERENHNQSIPQNHMQSWNVHTNDKTHYTVIDEQKLNIRKPTYTLHTDGSIEPLSTETWRERDRRFAEVTESRSRSDRLRLRKRGGLRRRERGGG